jgi:hypothetical protein
VGFPDKDSLKPPVYTAAARPRNRFDRLEWAGAFSDLGTLIPFVVAYIAVLQIDPFGILFTFGSAKIDRRISVAPMMDWTDEVYFGLLLTDLTESKNACRLYVASKK